MTTTTSSEVMVVVDVRDLPLFKGYMFVWCIRAYCFYYTAFVIQTFKTMRVGNIMESLMNVIKGLVYAQRLVVMDLEHIRQPALRAYAHLSGYPINY